MIKNFSDHSSNERTYLAWIRTGVAVMAFGFLVEKFDIFLFYIAKALHKKTPPQGGFHYAQALGMGLVLIGILMMTAATVRFAWITREIDNARKRDRDSPWPGILVGSVLIAMGILLLFYLAHLNGGPH